MLYDSLLAANAKAARMCSSSMVINWYNNLAFELISVYLSIIEIRKETMNNIIVYPSNKKQERLLRSLLEEMKVHFDVENQNDDTLFSEKEFYAKIDNSIQQAESGQIQRLSKERQKDLLGL